MNTHDYPTVLITIEELEYIEQLANDGELTATMVEKVINYCAEIVRRMKFDSHLPDKSQAMERVIKAIATLDRLHEAVKLNSKRIKEQSK